jgi:hypothetical protein
VARAVDFARLKIASMRAHPYTCPLFAGWNRHLERLDGLLARPLPEVARALRGVVVRLDQLDLLGAVDVKAVAVAVGDTQALLGQLRQLPPFAGLVVPANGQPAPLALDLLPMMPKSWIAMSGSTLGVGMGNGMDAALGRALTAPPAKSRPFFYVVYDPVKWNRVVSQLGGMASAFAMDADGGKVGMWIGVNKHGLELGYELVGR